MAPPDLRRRDARIDELRGRRALTDAEREELRLLEQARDMMWMRLPDRIARIRSKLETLTAYADEIGLGPC
ncbi:hypothetical protein [Sphingomonas sp.]|uniref:hypothetical protein n=1 Tax=Sphingomonas sp. TaxID=28214 RepID=UPI00258073D5|nr:hypothetical protein [Sphingomonas sp.]